MVSTSRTIRGERILIVSSTVMAERAPEQSIASTSRPWTTRRLLTWMTEYFTEREIDSPRVVAELLLSHVIGCERMRLYMEVDRPAAPLELETLRALVKRAGRHEPAQYLVGEWHFFGRTFEVDRSTLIPRPSTETLIEAVLSWHKTAGQSGSEPLIADIGTGTGCIAVTLAAQIPEAHLIATDPVAEALELAERNAARHKVGDRITFASGRGLEPLEAGPPGRRFAVICSNPPYISDAEWEKLEPNVREYEPATALRGGQDGLEIVRPLVAGAGRLLKPGGLLAIEIGHHQKEAALALVKETADLEHGEVLKDTEGFWRVLLARKRLQAE